MNESPFSPGLEPEKHLFSVLVCHFPPKSYHETANLLLGPRALGSVDSEKFPMDWPWRGSRLGHSVHGQKSKKKKTTAALPRVPRWVPYLAPATRHRTSHGRTSTQPRRRHGSPIDRRRPTRQHHLRPGVQYKS